VSFYVALPLLLLLALVEAVVEPMFRIAGLQPNLVLALLTVWLIVRGQNEAFFLIPAGGLFLGLVDGAPLGTALIALAPLVLLQDIRGSQLTEGGLVMALIFVVIMTFAYHVTYLGVFILRGESGFGVISAATRVIIPTALLNCVAVIPLYWVVNMFSGELRRPGYI